MNGFERFARKPQPVEEDALELDDFKSSPEVYALLAKLPRDLQPAHMKHVDGMQDELAAAYLADVLEKREKASVESYVSDESIRPYMDAHAEEVWRSIETDVYTGTDNMLGTGMTARVKRFEPRLEDGNEALPSMAIKYLIAPTAKTLSASGEHDLIREVERIQQIELAEQQSVDPATAIRVPHPYFSHRTAKIQCYGMEEIAGINLREALENTYSPEMKETLRASLRDLDTEALYAEVDRFFDVMHTVCLHGDMKPQNIMVSGEGKFFVIDFGQSVLTTNVDDRSAPAFENLKEEEKKNAKMAITYFLQELAKD